MGVEVYGIDRGVVFVCTTSERPVNVPVTAFDWAGKYGREEKAEKWLQWIASTGRDIRDMCAAEIDTSIEVFAGPSVGGGDDESRAAE